MSPTLMRLVVWNGPGAWKRLGAVAAGIAIGVTMLLTLLGASTALQARDERTSWMNFSAQPASDDGGHPIAMTDETALVSAHVEMFRGEPIWQLDVAMTPTSRVELPGRLTLPPVGSALVSPALADLADAVPHDQLGDRFGIVAGHLPPDVLKGPDALVAIRSVDEPELRDRAKLWLVSSFDGSDSRATSTYQTILVVGAVALAVPVILLVSIVTQFGAAQRRERYQTLRLIGAAPRSVVAFAATETAVVSLAGGAAAVGITRLVRPLVARIAVDGTGFYAADLSLDAPTTAAVVATVAVLCVLVAAWRVAREGIGPLGVTRQHKERTPRARRVTMPLAGLLVIGTTVVVPSLPTATRQLLAIAGFALVAFGIIVAGPWVVHVASRLLRRRAASAGTVIAASWFERHPSAAFRSVAGLVVAVFTVSLFAGASSVATASATQADLPGLLAADAAYAQIAPGSDPASIQAEAARVPGIVRSVVGYAAGTDDAVDRIAVSADDARALGFTGVPSSGCVAFDRTFVAPDADTAAGLTEADCSARGRASVLFVLTDGSEPAMERAKTWAATSPDMASSLLTRRDSADSASLGALDTLARLAYIGVMVAVVIAGLSLIVSAAASVLDNRRTYGLMRLMGMRHQTLWRVVAIQALVPLLSTMGLTIAVGFGVAWLLVTGWSDGLTMTWPDARYYAAIACATLIAAIAVCATFPTVRSSTRVQVTRFE